MHTIKNVSRNTKTINLSGRKGSLHLPRRGKAALTKQEFESSDVQVLLRGGYLVEIGGEG